MVTRQAPPKEPQTKPDPKPTPRVKSAKKTDSDPFDPDWPNERLLPEPKG